MKPKILLVDDDTRNSMLLCRFLKAEGFDVTYANNGAVGLELYHTVGPDLILLDINMPVNTTPIGLLTASSATGMPLKPAAGSD